MKMIIEFLDWFGDFVANIFESTYTVGKIMVWILLAVTTFPIWAVPFIFWCFFERGKDDAAD